MDKGIIVLCICVIIWCSLSEALRFKEVTDKYGLPRRSTIKYGGASISDLDGDDLMDIIEYHHTECCATIHFNNGPNKKFTQYRLKYKSDIHAIVPFLPSPSIKNRRFVSISVGGSNGNRPTRPKLLIIDNERHVNFFNGYNESNIFPLNSKGRGRTIIYTYMRRSSNRLGALLINAPSPTAKKGAIVQTALEWKNGRFERPKGQYSLGDLGKDFNNYGLVTDIDNDNRMEIVMFEELRMYNLTFDLNYKDISKQVNLPKDIIGRKVQSSLKGVSGLAEIDFNNDGFWDLYVIRSAMGDLKWIRQLSYNRRYQKFYDYLLMNDRGKRYRSIRMTNILSGSHRGITSGDFNNDGYIDLYISSQSTKYDYILMNHFGKTFKVKKIRRYAKGPGDMVHTIDINNDGKLDLLVSTGDWHDIKQRGQFYLLQNIATSSQIYPNYLYVHVFNSPDRKVSHLHAVVKVKLHGRKGMMMRRVAGSNGPGTALSINHHIHFGMGRFKMAEWVVVIWPNGQKQWFTNIPSKSTLIAGKR